MNIKPIDFTDCHPEIAKVLKQGKMIECWVWNDNDKKEKRWIILYFENGYFDKNLYLIRINNWTHAEPVDSWVPEKREPVLCWHTTYNTKAEIMSFCFLLFVFNLFITHLLFVLFICQ